MQSKHEFKATVREGKGKASAATLRRAGQVPAVIYGQGKEPLSLSVDAAAIQMLIAKTWGLNALIIAKVDDGKGAITEKTVMFKEYQKEPVKDNVIHVDFYNVDFEHEIKLRVPVVLEGSPAALKEGGILEHGVRSLRVRCLPKAIPQAIKVDVSNLGLDQNILLQDVAKQEGVTFLDNAHTVLAHVALVEEEKAPVAAEGAVAPEVIGEKEREAARTAKEGDKGAPGGKDAKAAPGGKDAKAAPAGKDAKAAPAAKAPGKK